MEIPRLEDVTLDSDVLGFVVLLIAITVLLVSLLPAIRFASPKVAVLLGDAARGSSESGRSIGWRRWLVAAQIAVAFILLVGASLMARSFLNLLQADLGFEPRNLLTFNLDLPDNHYPTHEAKRAFYRALLQRLESLPGVVGAAGTSNRPFRGDEIGDDWSYYIEGQTEADSEQNPRAIAFTVTADYFRTMNIQLLRGRTFTERDDARTERVIVISESLARQAWPGQEAIGKRLCCSWSQDLESYWLTVIGVVENARYRDVHEPRLDLYNHHLQAGNVLASFFVRTRFDPLMLAGPVRAELSALDPARSIEEFTTMEALMSGVYAPWRFNMVGFGVFALVALGLAGLGLFGLLAFSVRQRTREIGIRIALGATNRAILKMVVVQAASVILAGAAVGVAGGLALTRVLGSLLYGTSATNLSAYLAVTAVMFVTALLATYLPARQAARVDPVVSLRHE